MKKTKLIISIVLTTIFTTSAVLAWVDLGTVSNGNTLTSTLWNTMISKINENGNKLNGIYNVGGNVGIGNSSPSYPLEISRSTETPTFIRVKNLSSGTTNDPGITFESRSSKYAIFANDESNQLYFWDGISNVMRMTIAGNGNVGIGTNSPSSKLDVVGSINSDYLELNAGGGGEGGEMRFKGDLGYGNIQIDNYAGNLRIHTLEAGKQFIVGGGSALANAWNVTSDIRKKENIKPIENVIDKIKNIRGVRFSWKDSGKKDVGVIAQEIEKEFPEFVTTATDGYKSVDYGKLSSVLIEGVKEQQKQIDELTEKNDQLEDRLKILEKKFKN